MKHIFGMFEKNFGKERLPKKTIKFVVMIISCRSRVKEARSIWSLILKIVLNKAKALSAERLELYQSVSQ